MHLNIFFGILSESEYGPKSQYVMHVNLTVVMFGFQLKSVFDLGSHAAISVMIYDQCCFCPQFVGEENTQKRWLQT